MMYYRANKKVRERFDKVCDMLFNVPGCKVNQI